jgi:hypothetical protein
MPHLFVAGDAVEPIEARLCVRAACGSGVTRRPTALSRIPTTRVDPAVLDEATAGQTSMMGSRTALQLTGLTRRHAELAREVEGDPGGTIDRAYAAVDR